MTSCKVTAWEDSKKRIATSCKVAAWEDSKKRIAIFYSELGKVDVDDTYMPTVVENSTEHIKKKPYVLCSRGKHYIGCLLQLDYVRRRMDVLRLIYTKGGY